MPLFQKQDTEYLDEINKKLSEIEKIIEEDHSNLSER